MKEKLKIMKNYGNNIKVVYFGNERLASGASTEAPLLKKMISYGYDVRAIVANDASMLSRKQRKLEVKEIAQENNIAILTPNKPSDIIDELRSFNADIAVLAAYGKIIPQPIIDIFPCGIVNLHPSLLPMHRGPTPIESCILNGESATGVSIMSLSKEMDAGPIYLQKKVPLKGSESKQQLVNELGTIGADMISDLLPRIISSGIKPEPQNPSGATYDKLISKSDGIIDWDKSAEVLEREIRAYLGWPGSKTEIARKEVTVTSARAIPEKGAPGAIDISSRKLVIHCSEGSLEIITLKPAGKKEMSGEAFLTGHKSAILET